MVKIILLTLLISIQVFSSVQYQNLRPKFEFYHDPSGIEPIEIVKEKDFTFRSEGGFFPGKVWARGKVCNNTNDQTFLLYKDPIESLHVYLGASTVPIVREFSRQTTTTSDFFVTIPVAISGCESLLVSFKYEDVMNFNLYLVDGKTLLSIERRHLFFFSLFYSFLGIVLILSILFFLKLRSRLYLYFAALIVTQDFLGASLLNGFLFHFVSPAKFIQWDLGNIFAPLMNISLVLFATEFLKERYRINTIISKAFVLFQIVLVSLPVIGLIFPVHHQSHFFSYLVNNSILFACFWVLYLAICNIGSFQASIFLFASGFKVVGQLVKTLLLQGDISDQLWVGQFDLSFFLFNIAAIGSLVEGIVIMTVIVFSYFKKIEEKNNEIAFMMKQLKQRDIDTAIAEKSKQVAHDIRSPLAALKMVTGNITAIPEEHRVLIRTAVQRIDDIANGLLNRSRENEPERAELETVLLSSLIESIVSEKRQEYRERKGIEIVFEINSTACGLFVRVNQSHFKRVVSNLINNSVEAIIDKGVVAVSLFTNGRCCTVRISDNGIGMTPEVLKNVGKAGFSYGKKGRSNSSGTGLGIYHARKVIESWSGKLKIESSEGSGTTVEIDLLLFEPPGWAVTNIRLKTDMSIYIVDDDASINEVWRRRFANSKNNSIKFSYYPSLAAFEVDLPKIVTSESLILMDYEFLGESQTGLDFIKKFNLEKNAILVTSRSEEDGLIKSAKFSGIRMLPKSLVAIVPINLH